MVETPKSSPQTPESIQRDTAEKLQALKKEIETKQGVQKEKGEIPKSEDIARYRSEIAAIREGKQLTAEQEGVLQGLETWFAECDKLNGATTQGLDGNEWKDRIDKLTGNANSIMGKAKQLGSWLLKMAASLFDDKSAIRKLILQLAHSKEAEFAYLRSFPALKGATDAQLESVRSEMEKGAAEIAKSRITRGAGEKDYDFVSLVDEATGGSKESVTSIEALRQMVADVLKKERAQPQPKPQAQPQSQPQVQTQPQVTVAPASTTTAPTNAPGQAASAPSAQPAAAVPLAAQPKETPKPQTK